MPREKDNHIATKKTLVPPAPAGAEQPAEYADRVGIWYSEQVTTQERKRLGTFFTPVSIARFMATQVAADGESVRVLDPSAGAGVLICATVEGIVTRDHAPASVEVVAYEVDRSLIEPLTVVLDHLKHWCAERFDVKVTVHIVEDDFVLANAVALFRHRTLPTRQAVSDEFDVVIANPPYFKVAKDDPRAVAAASVVHGQPNIYGLFMAVGASLLRRGGSFVFIVPRSFASGAYFRALRVKLFDLIRPKTVHVFGSRRDAFRREDVLQENVIICGVRDDVWHDRQTPYYLRVTSSEGVDGMDRNGTHTVPLGYALDVQATSRVLRLPLSDADEVVLELVDKWQGSLDAYGLKVSTGPVIPFRATEFIDTDGAVAVSHAPLIWMNHVRAMQLSWPGQGCKPKYISYAASALLVPNRNYVLPRRFSAKEDRRRLVAAPYIAREFGDTAAIGIENHLNYVHRPNGTLSEDETWGLTALYNSALLDSYFRCISSNTQVSATELREIPLPDIGVIVELGRQAKRLTNPTVGLDELVAETVTGAGERAGRISVG